MPKATTAPAITAAEMGDLRSLIPSWARSLRAERKSPKTIVSYTSGAEQLASFLVANGMPTDVAKIRREHVESFFEDCLGRYRPSTAATRYRDLQQLFRWLVEEGEVSESPMAKMRPPKLDETPVPIIPDDHLRALFDTCSGRTFEDRRDTAIMRLLLNTGARLAEVANLTLEDVDLDYREMRVMGKGRKARTLPLGAKAPRTSIATYGPAHVTRAQTCRGYGSARRVASQIPASPRWSRGAAKRPALTPLFTFTSSDTRSRTSGSRAAGASTT